MKEKEGWEFIFVGANIDAVEVAGRMGISKERTANYVSDSMGTALAFGSICTPMSEMRRGKKISREWAEALEEDKLNRGH